MWLSGWWRVWRTLKSTPWCALWECTDIEAVFMQIVHLNYIEALKLWTPRDMTFNDLVQMLLMEIRHLFWIKKRFLLLFLKWEISLLSEERETKTQNNCLVNKSGAKYWDSVHSIIIIIIMKNAHTKISEIKSPTSDLETKLKQYHKNKQTNQQIIFIYIYFLKKDQCWLISSLQLYKMQINSSLCFYSQMCVCWARFKKRVLLPLPDSSFWFCMRSIPEWPVSSAWLCLLGGWV